MSLEQLIDSVRYNLLYLATGSKKKEFLKQIIDAMRVVDRIYFVHNKENAYLDTALSIGYNQTISQPSTVARMLLLAELESGNNILELGAGSGWNASVAGYLVYPGKVLSLDIVPQLVEKARENLISLQKTMRGKLKDRLNNIEFRTQNVFAQLDDWQEDMIE